MMCAHCGDRIGPLLVNDGLTECESYVACQKRIEWDQLARSRPRIAQHTHVLTATFLGADGERYTFTKVRPQ